MILLDTNILSELTKPQPNPRVVSWLAEQEPVLALPTIALAELRYGIERLADGERKRGLLRFWAKTRDTFAGRTYAFDVGAAEAYGLLVVAAERVGRPVTVGDGQIAAIAFTRNMTVATRDTSGFEPTGIRLVNPWL